MAHSHEHAAHDHTHEASLSISTLLPAILSASFLALGLLFQYLAHFTWFENHWMRLLWYVVAFLPVGFPVMKEAIVAMSKRNFFTEFTLMSVATIGAFVLGEYPEAVAVMLFYAVGELFQNAAVNQAQKNIQALLDVRPKNAHVLRDGVVLTVDPTLVEIGEVIEVKVGERLPLDGVLVNTFTACDTAAITGESLPKEFNVNDELLAGMVNLSNVIEVRVTKKYNDSSLATILNLLQHAYAKKAKTELFIQKFAAIYTPIVFLLALLLAFLPYFFVDEYLLTDWMYRALIFLVISCPCALVISIPLGYFGGIGAASRNGILVKGSNYLDLLAAAKTVVMDKTGTLTKGNFSVQSVHVLHGETHDFWNVLIALEAKSTHPIAKALQEYATSAIPIHVVDVTEIAGHGLKAMYQGEWYFAGNARLLKSLGISPPIESESALATLVYLANATELLGYVLVADELKEDAPQAIESLRELGIEQIVMLSGDKHSIVESVAKTLGITSFYGELLPEDKVRKVEELKNKSTAPLLFVGDGMNDAPVLALSDIGIAMGNMGSDLAIESSDVIIQNDQPLKIATAIRIGKKTKQIVIQNIGLAFGVKLVVLFLGASGLATMWEAVFADVGVAFLAILNAMRIQRMKF